MKHEGDPGAALIAFSTNAEASAAYHSSEPVFNNRFIKLFWHNKEKQNEGANNSNSVSVLLFKKLDKSFTFELPLKQDLWNIFFRTFRMLPRKKGLQ